MIEAAGREDNWPGGHALLYAVIIGKPPAVEVVGLVHDEVAAVRDARARAATTLKCWPSRDS